MTTSKFTGSILAVVLILASALFLMTRAGASGASQPVSAAPLAPSDAPLVVPSVHEPPHREEADWMPDGRLWVCPMGDDGHRLSDARLAVVPRSARSFIVDGCIAQAVEGSGGWLIAKQLVDGAAAYAVVARGYLPYWLVDASPNVRHVLQMARGHAAEVVARDIVTRELVGEVSIRVSAAAFDAAAWEPDSLPGIDPSTAITYVVTDKGGRANMHVAIPPLNVRIEIAHQQYVAARSMDGDIPFRAAIDVDLQMPVVAAVKYVGDRVISGEIVAKLPSMRNRRTALLLDGIRSSICGTDPNVLAAVMLPDSDPAKAPKIAAKASFESAESRMDIMKAVALRDFTSPVEIAVVPRPGLPPPAKVRILPPPAFFGGVMPDFKIVVSGDSAFTPRATKFGEAIELPEGIYKVSGYLGNTRDALDDSVFKVTSGQDIDVQAKWRDGVIMHSLTVKTETPVRRVGIQYEQDGRSYALEASVGPAGRVDVWMTRRLGSVKVHAADHESIDVVLRAGESDQLMIGSCSMHRVKK